jgi:hypothetical protein
MYIQQAISRKDLLKIVRTNFPKANLIATALRLGQLVNDIEALRAADRMVYNQNGRLVRRILIGERWENQTRQRRRVRREFPLAPIHRPKRMWPRYFVAELGREYTRQTGRQPKRGAAGGSLSPFERFAEPMLKPLGISDVQGLVREFVEERKKPNPWG